MKYTKSLRQKALKNFRMGLGLTAEEFAPLLGCSHKDTIYKKEHGNRPLSAKDADLLASISGIPAPAWLYPDSVHNPFATGTKKEQKFFLGNIDEEKILTLTKHQKIDIRRRESRRKICQGCTRGRSK